MKFLIDECVGPTVAEWLNQNKYNVTSIYDEFSGMDDDSILNKAFLENRILITSDKDFGEMIFRDKKEHCGVILLRLFDERSLNKICILESILQNHYQDLPNNFVVVTENTVRIIKQYFS